MIWTNEADALLAQLWDEGCSLNYVADGMAQAGYVVTRNAVAGRKHRLREKIGFARLSKLPIKSRMKPKAQRSRTVKIPSTKPVSVIELEALRRQEGVHYLDNPHNGCKAILDRPRAGEWLLPMVCGKPRGCDYEGRMSPYCPTHFRLHTSPSTVRRQHG